MIQRRCPSCTAREGAVHYSTCTVTDEPTKTIFDAADWKRIMALPPNRFTRHLTEYLDNKWQRCEPPPPKAHLVYIGTLDACGLFWWREGGCLLLSPCGLVQHWQSLSPDITDALEPTESAVGSIH